MTTVVLLKAGSAICITSRDTASARVLGMLLYSEGALWALVW